MTLGKYHVESMITNATFRLVNDSTGRAISTGKTFDEFTEHVLPGYGRFKLDYVSLRPDNILEYHISAGMLAEEALVDMLKLDKAKLVDTVVIKDELKRVLLETDISSHFDLGGYKYYRVKSSRIYLKKAIITVYNNQGVSV